MRLDRNDRRAFAGGIVRSAHKSRPQVVLRRDRTRVERRLVSRGRSVDLRPHVGVHVVSVHDVVVGTQGDAFHRRCRRGGRREVARLPLRRIDVEILREPGGASARLAVVARGQVAPAQLTATATAQPVSAKQPTHRAARHAYVRSGRRHVVVGVATDHEVAHRDAEGAVHQGEQAQGEAQPASELQGRAHPHTTHASVGAESLWHGAGKSRLR